MIPLQINGRRYEVEIEPDVPLLWVIREQLKLTGTKFGCGIGMCGACTVHVAGKAQRSCQIPVGEAQGKENVALWKMGGDNSPYTVSFIPPTWMALVDLCQGREHASASMAVFMAVPLLPEGPCSRQDA